MQSLRFAGFMLLVCFPLAGAAAASDAERVFNQLPEEIQNRILSEAEEARTRCNAGGLVGPVLYDCDCVSDKVRDTRTLRGPDASGAELYDAGFATGSECLERDKVATYMQHQCKQFSAELAPIPADRQAFCACYVAKRTERFMKLPSLHGPLQGQINVEVRKECDYNKYLARVMEQRKASAPPKPVTAAGEPPSPWPWEWVRLDMNAIEMDRAFRQAGLKTRSRPCKTANRCRAEYIGELKDGTFIQVRFSFRKNRLDSLTIKADYPASMSKKAARRIAASVDDSMLKQYPDLNARQQSLCNAKRTGCGNLPAGKDWQGNELFRTFFLSPNKKSNRGDVSLSVDYRLIRRSDIGERLRIM